MIRHLTMTAAIVALSIALGTGVHAGPNAPPGHAHTNYKDTPVNQAAGIVGQTKTPERKLLKGAERRKLRRISKIEEKIANAKADRRAHKQVKKGKKGSPVGKKLKKANENVHKFKRRLKKLRG